MYACYLQYVAVSSGATLWSFQHTNSARNQVDAEVNDIPLAQMVTIISVFISAATQRAAPLFSVLSNINI